MTVKLSKHKVARILGLYFRGLTQPHIARKVGVDQSTVSVYASRFRARAGQVGLAAAGKEFQVFSEVDSLRSLAVELSNGKLSTEEAMQGVHIMKWFSKMGVNPDQHARLVQVCGAVDDPGFVTAALKLSQLEKQSGASYEAVVSQFEGLIPKLKTLQRQVDATKVELEKLGRVVESRKHELRRLDEELDQYREGVAHKEARLDQELKEKKAQFHMSVQEAAELSKLRASMTKAGVTMSTLLQLIKEFKS